MVDEVPILTIFFTVDEHETKEKASLDKPDTFKVSLVEVAKSLKIGLQDAKAKLQIKAYDDIVKHNFPKQGKFVCKIYRARGSVPPPQGSTQQKSLEAIQ